MERPGGSGHPVVGEQPIPVNLTDLYLLIGEREVIRHLQQKRITELMEENAQLRSMLVADPQAAGGS